MQDTTDDDARARFHRLAEFRQRCWRYLADAPRPEGAEKGPLHDPHASCARKLHSVLAEEGRGLREREIQDRPSWARFAAAESTGSLLKIGKLLLAPDRWSEISPSTRGQILQLLESTLASDEAHFDDDDYDEIMRTNGERHGRKRRAWIQGRNDFDLSSSTKTPSDDAGQVRDLEMGNVERVDFLVAGGWRSERLATGNDPGRPREGDTDRRWIVAEIQKRTGGATTREEMKASIGLNATRQICGELAWPNGPANVVVLAEVVGVKRRTIERDRHYVMSQNAPEGGRVLQFPSRQEALDQEEAA